MGTAKHLNLRAMRLELNMSQSELARHLCVSPRTIQSCEQGWRQLSPALERTALFLLMIFRNGSELGARSCWEETSCPPSQRDACITRRTSQGHLCWFLPGSLCKGASPATWQDKMGICLSCPFLKELFRGEIPLTRDPEAIRGAS